jgi:Family of unknown function (DUF6064)
VGLPFTSEQFFGVFAEYNHHFWVVAVAWWGATIAALALTCRHTDRSSPAMAFFMGGLWLWNAVAYHAWLFTRINPAAWLFSALFAFEGALFIWTGNRRSLRFLASSGASQIVGLALAAYSLACPFLTTAFVHSYPAAPTYGLPCPTVLLTIGLLLTVPGGVPLTLAVIPIAWGFVGGSAAILLDVQTDYGLLAAGGFLLVIVIAQRMRLRLATQ